MFYSKKKIPQILKIKFQNKIKYFEHLILQDNNPF